MDSTDPKPKFTAEQLNAWLAEAFDDRPDTKPIEYHGRSCKELAASWRLSDEKAMERIHEMVAAGRMDCVYERRMTITKHAASKPVYIEIGERGA